MAFTVAAIVLGGFTLYNLSNGASSFWAMDAQQRHAAQKGNKHANINLDKVMSHWKPLYDPKLDMSTDTMYRKFKAYTDTVSNDPMRQQRGTHNIKKYNYRKGSGYSAPTPRNLDLTFG